VGYESRRVSFGTAYRAGRATARSAPGRPGGPGALLRLCSIHDPAADFSGAGRGAAGSGCAAPAGVAGAGAAVPTGAAALPGLLLVALLGIAGIAGIAGRRFDRRPAAVPGASTQAT